MAVNWKAISDNLVNISLVLTDFMDTNNPKDISWIFTDNEGNVKNINIPNIAKVLKNVENDLSNKVETVIGDYLMFSNSKPTSNVNPKYRGFLYVKYDVDNPNRSEIYVCVDNTENKNVWGRISGGELVIDVSDDIEITPGVQYFVDTSTKSINLTLPAEPNHNDTVVIADGRNNAQNNPANVLRNGKLINDKDENLICDVNSFYVILRYDQNGSWYVTNAIKNS